MKKIPKSEIAGNQFDQQSDLVNNAYFNLLSNAWANFQIRNIWIEAWCVSQRYQKGLGSYRVIPMSEHLLKLLSGQMAFSFKLKLLLSPSEIITTTRSTPH